MCEGDNSDTHLSQILKCNDVLKVIKSLNSWHQDN